MANSAIAETYKRIKVNDVTLAYTCHGSAHDPAMVLCHPHLADLRSFDDLVPQLSAKFHVIAYSRRYAWPNTPIRDTQPDDWHQHASDLCSLTTALALPTPIHVLGNSSGGTIALLLAVSHPELVRTLILIEPSLPTIFLPRLPPGPWDVLRFLWQHPLCFFPVMLFGATLVAQTEAACKANPPDHAKALAIFGPGAISQKSWDNLTPERMQQVHDNETYMFHLFKCSRLPAIPETKLKAMDVPTLLITGSETITVSKLIDWKLAQVLPKAESENVDGAGHFVHEEKPREVGDLVKDWVAQAVSA